MKTLVPIVSLCVVALLFSGCSEQAEQAEPVQTVDWYKEHEGERIAMIQKCQNNPGKMAATPNCINSIQAAADLEKEEMSRLLKRPARELPKNLLAPRP